MMFDLLFSVYLFIHVASWSIICFKLSSKNAIYESGKKQILGIKYIKPKK